MKNLKPDQNMEQSSNLTVVNTAQKRNKYFFHLKSDSKLLKKSPHKFITNVNFYMNSSSRNNKAPTKYALKRVRLIQELSLVVNDNYDHVKEFIYALSNLRIKKLHVIIEHFCLFQKRKLNGFLRRLCTNHIQKLSFSIRCSDGSLAQIITKATNSFTFEDLHFKILCRNIRSLPRMKSLDLVLNSQTIANLTSKTLTTLAYSLSRLKNLLSFSLKVSIKNITEESVNSLGQGIKKQKKLQSLCLYLTGFRKINPENLFVALSYLVNLKIFSLEIDCGWDEPTLKDVANCFKKFSNLQVFHLSYAPLHRMAYNPVFCQALNTLTQLRELLLNLSSLHEEELFEFCHSLRFLINLQKITLNFLCTTFNTKNGNRLGESLAKLQGLKEFFFKFSQCKFQPNIIKNTFEIIESLKNITQFVFHLIRCEGTEDEDLLIRLLKSLKNTSGLNTFDLKLNFSSMSPMNQNVKFSYCMLSDFINEHKELETLLIDLPKEAFTLTTEKDLNDFFKRQKKRNFKSIKITQSGSSYFEKKLL